MIKDRLRHTEPQSDAKHPTWWGCEVETLTWATEPSPHRETGSRLYLELEYWELAAFRSTQPLLGKKLRSLGDKNNLNVLRGTKWYSYLPDTLHSKKYNFLMQKYSFGQKYKFTHQCGHIWQEKRLAEERQGSCLLQFISKDGPHLFYFLSFFPSLSLCFFVCCFLSHCGACRILVPNQGLNPHPLQQKHRVLTTGLSGKSLSFFLLINSKAARLPLLIGWLVGGGGNLSRHLKSSQI